MTSFYDPDRGVFGYCPNDHKETLTHQHTDACYGIQDQRRIGPLCGFAASTPAQQFEAAAVQTAKDSVQRFAERLASEEAMKDTEQPLFKPSVVENMFDPYVKHFERVAKMEKDNRVLTERIEQLEATIDELRPMLTSALADVERMAATLKAFYYAPLTLSAVQPILALACELNADLVEQRR